MSLICETATYKHRKYNRVDCPSWGEEGWTLTPLSGYSSADSFQAPFTFDDGTGLVKVALPRFDTSVVQSIVVKIKSTLLMKRVTIEQVTDDFVYLSDPDRIITEDYVGGIIAIARFNTESPSWDIWRNFSVDLKYQKESGTIHPMAAIYYKGEPLKLDPRYLHEMKLTADWDGMVVDVPTAWVDPGFDGVLYVPFGDSCKAELSVTSYFYTGSNKYQGYKGDDRLYKNANGDSATFGDTRWKK